MDDRLTNPLEGTIKAVKKKAHRVGVIVRDGVIAMKGQIVKMMCFSECVSV
jgi:hypothetical protein